MRAITIINSEIADEIAPDFEIKNSKVKIDTDSGLYFFSHHLAGVIINAHLRKIVRRAISKKAYIKDLRDFYPSEYSKMVLARLLYLYLLDNSMINTEGFLDFRAQIFSNIIKKEVEEYFKKKQVEHEYDEFIGLLRYFVAIQKPKVIEAHVKIEEDNFFIYDENEKDITYSCILAFAQNMGADGNYKRDDLLISSLIFLSPRRIFFSNFGNLKNEQLKKTIKDVFGEKLSIAPATKP